MPAGKPPPALFVSPQYFACPPVWDQVLRALQLSKKLQFCLRRGFLLIASYTPRQINASLKSIWNFHVHYPSDHLIPAQQQRQAIFAFIRTRWQLPGRPGTEAALCGTQHLLSGGRSMTPRLQHRPSGRFPLCAASARQTSITNSRDRFPCPPAVRPSHPANKSYCMLCFAEAFPETITGKKPCFPSKIVLYFIGYDRENSGEPHGREGRLWLQAPCGRFRLVRP